jgi:hypothetical protein
MQPNSRAVGGLFYPSNDVLTLVIKIDKKP